MLILIGKMCVCYLAFTCSVILPLYYSNTATVAHNLNKVSPGARLPYPFGVLPKFLNILGIPEMPDFL